jgi:hypothetical protein
LRSYCRPCWSKLTVGYQRNSPKRKKWVKKYNDTPQRKTYLRCMDRLRGFLSFNSDAYHPLIGCTPKQLAAHIESQFQEGMSWDNKGEWHVDHVVPCSKFDLTDEKQRRRAFNYTNLQPLWGTDNLMKGAK